MSATSRTIPADAGIGQLAIVFAALLVGVALMAALAYGPLTASQVSLSPAAAPAPAAMTIAAAAIAARNRCARDLRRR